MQMGNNTDKVTSLGEAVTLYLGKLTVKNREDSQPEVYKFARWCGWEGSFSKLAGPAVAGYAETINVSDIDYEKKFSILRAFLAHAKKAGWSQTNLATHLKSKKGKGGPTKKTKTSSRDTQPETATLTQERYDELQAELESLKKRSRELMGEIQRAAADKDFRENAPLHAAREERGHVEGRIKELEPALKTAVIIQENKGSSKKSTIGDCILVCDLATNEECRYTIVDTREVNVLKGKISIGSPLGKALLGRVDGDTIEINVPAGKLRYQVKKIER
jgi:transcription elongation factor GreA